MMGYGGNKDLTEYLRLYIALHGDHEGGNASAHTSRMFVSSQVSNKSNQIRYRPRRVYTC